MNTSNLRHHGMTRDQVLVAHAAEMIARTSFSQDDFAQELSRQLHLSIPGKASAKDVPDFHLLAKGNDTGAFLKASGSWLRRVGRWLSGEVDMPSWLEESWADALPPEYRERCINELASRHGLTGARLAGSASCPVTAFAQLVTRLGRAVEAGSEVLADGKIDQDDVPHLPAFIDRLLAVESRACELRRHAENELSIYAGKPILRVAG